MSASVEAFGARIRPGARAELRSVPWWRIRLYPAAFLPLYVVLLWADSGIELSTLVRPLLVAGAASILLTLLCSFLTGDPDRGAFAAACLLLTLLTSSDPIALLLSVVALAVVAEGVLHRSRPSWVARVATRLMSLVVFVLLVATVISGTQAGAWSDIVEDLTTPALAPLPAGTASAAAPDIYVILLDAFPGDRAAAHASGYDADAFPDALTSRGFDVIRDSHSNYLETQLTLTSMFWMRHLVDIPSLAPPFGPQSHDWWRIKTALNDSPAMDALRKHGYETISIDGGYAHAHLDRVDRFIGQPTPPELELAVINNTRLRKLVSAVAPTALPQLARDRIHDAFATADRIADEAHDRQRFVFVHVAAPHPPWVFEADGSPRDPGYVSVTGEGTIPVQDSYDVGFAQATYIAGEATKVVDRILASSKQPPVIVVMSDHGPGSDFSWTDPLHSDYVARASNLMAAYTPGHPGLIGDRLTPVNLFPTLFDAYLGVHVERQPDTIWAWRDSDIDAIEVPPVPGWAR